MMTQSRRSFLRKLAAQAIAIPFGTFGYQALVSAAETPRLDPNDSAATALGYTHTAPNASKSCGGCQLFKGSATAQWGRCAVFPGKLVNANGWCYSWSAWAETGLTSNYFETMSIRSYRIAPPGAAGVTNQDRGHRPDANSVLTEFPWGLQETGYSTFVRRISYRPRYR